jgi:hypothetical protein
VGESEGNDEREGVGEGDDDKEGVGESEDDREGEGDVKGAACMDFLLPRIGRLHDDHRPAPAAIHALVVHRPGCFPYVIVGRTFISVTYSQVSLLLFLYVHHTWSAHAL